MVFSIEVDRVEVAVVRSCHLAKIDAVSVFYIKTFDK